VPEQDLYLFQVFVHLDLFPDQPLGHRIPVGLLCSALHKRPYVESENMLSKLSVNGSNELDNNRLHRPRC
jgi:hypothetical protein